MDPKQLPSLHLLPVHVEGKVQTAGQALQSIALDPAILNPEVLLKTGIYPLLGGHFSSTFRFLAIPLHQYPPFITTQLMSIESSCRQGGFTPVLAIGSNAAPSQLARKYGGGEPSWPQMDVAVPCVRLGLEDHDVVYCPLLSSYGSIPATLQADATRVCTPILNLICACTF